MSDSNQPKPGQKLKMTYNSVVSSNAGWHEPPVTTVDTSSMQSEIGIQLRAIYETMIAAPIPDRFLKLLEQLDRSTDGTLQNSVAQSPIPSHPPVKS